MMLSMKVALVALLACVSALPQSEVAKRQSPTTLCGNDQHIILQGTPWLVANSMYGAWAMAGSACTRYERIENGPNGNRRVVWGGTTNIQYVKNTDNICKGYSNVGIIGNLEHSISSISSVPASFEWTRRTNGPFKGNICFDFILSPNRGDSTSRAAQELMVWLNWNGGQLPIGWDRGPAATIPNLFGTSWKIYEDINTGNGMTVHSMLPDRQFSGSFAGDLKHAFEALVRLGRFSEGTFVNIGNAGSELFYGNSVLEAKLGVQINLR